MRLAVVGLLGLVLTLTVVAQARAVHVSCGDILTRDTTLDSDLVDCPGNGVVLGADGITLHLGGYTVDGANRGAGVTNRPGEGIGFNDVTVQGGVIKEFDSGVAFTLCSGCALEGATVTANDRGVVLRNAGDGRIEDNVIVLSRADGLLMDDSPENRIAGNLARDNGSHGIAMNHSSKNAVIRNSLKHNGGDGIFGFDSHDLRLFENVANKNGRHGLSLRFSHRTQVRGNWATGNAVHGVALNLGVSESRMLANVALENGGGGVSLGQVDHNRVIANVVARNGASGLQLGNEFGLPREVRVAHTLAVANILDGIAIAPGTAATTLGANVVVFNHDDGIDADVAAATIARSVAWENDDLGIEAATGVTDEGRNRANENGNDLQCTNVLCRPDLGRRGEEEDEHELCDDDEVMLVRHGPWPWIKRDEKLFARPVISSGARSTHGASDFLDDLVCEREDQD